MLHAKTSVRAAMKRKKEWLLDFTHEIWIKSEIL